MSCIPRSRISSRSDVGRHLHHPTDDLEPRRTELKIAFVEVETVGARDLWSYHTRRRSRPPAVFGRWIIRRRRVRPFGGTREGGTDG
jgi:hypothetical protein